MPSRKPTLKWVESRYSDSYVSLPQGDERGRVVPAHVWGPDAESEATESRTLEPDEHNPPGTLVQAARTWVEERVKFLDKQGSTSPTRP